jgi:hypothetical protein
MRATRHCIPGDISLHNDSCDNLKYYKISTDCNEALFYAFRGYQHILLLDPAIVISSLNGPGILRTGSSM